MTKVTKWSYVMFILGIAVLTLTSLMNLLPSPLITTIVGETGWTLEMAGNLMSIVTLVVGFFVFAGSKIQDKLGVKMLGVISLLICCIGGIIPFFAGESFAAHMLGRIVFGVGYGMSMNIATVIVSLWFPSNLQPAMNGIRVFFSYVGLSLPYYIILPIYNSTGSWQTTFGVFGIIAGVLAVIFLIFGRNVEQDESVSEEVEDKPEEKKQSGLAQAVRSKEVWLLAVAMLAILWGFNAFSTYLPTYLELERGMTAAAASSTAGIMPVMGAVAGLVCGVLSSIVGRRKLFGYPMFILMIAGLLITLFTDGILMSIGIAMIGFGSSGFNIIISTIPAELPQSNPSFYGGALALIFGFAYIPSYFMPMVFGALYRNGAGLPIGTIYLIFGALFIVGLITTLMVPETGPKAKKKNKT